MLMVLYSKLKIVFSMIYCFLNFQKEISLVHSCSASLCLNSISQKKYCGRNGILKVSKKEMAVSQLQSGTHVCSCTVMPGLCDNIGCHPSGSSVHRMFQARILECAISYCRGSYAPRDSTCVSCVSCISRWILYPQYQLESTE